MKDNGCVQCLSKQLLSTRHKLMLEERKKRKISFLKQLWKFSASKFTFIFPNTKYSFNFFHVNNNLKFLQKWYFIYFVDVLSLCSYPEIIYIVDTKCSWFFFIPLFSLLTFIYASVQSLKLFTNRYPSPYHSFFMNILW